jgi:plastocyanin
MRRPIARSLLAVVVFAIASSSLVQLASARPNGQAAAKTVRVKGGEFFFRLSTKSLARPGKVVFVFRNVGHVLHDFKIHGKKTPLIGPGKTAKLVVSFKKKGKYPYLCTVPGHAAAGMKGVFTVR